MNCENAILFSTVYPCLLCAKIIVECGISKVIYDKDYNSEFTKKIFESAGVQIIKWNAGFDKFL